MQSRWSTLVIAVGLAALSACAAGPMNGAPDSEQADATGAGGSENGKHAGANSMVSRGGSGGGAGGGRSVGGAGGMPSTLEPPVAPQPCGGAFCSKQYRNLFSELGQGDAAITGKLQAAFAQLFHGDAATERIYFELAPDLAYVEDIHNGDVRSEGISYGMMIAVQLDKQAEFDRLWRYAATVLRNSSGPRQGYFAWQARGRTVLDPNPAPDGDEYIAMALFFASGRWGNGSGLYDYRAQANAILRSMLHRENVPSGEGVTPMFDARTKLVVFTPVGSSATFTDASYHLPGFYQLWSAWADTDQAFWSQAAVASRAFLAKVAHPVTGLSPKLSEFDGSLRGDGREFGPDSWRVAHNIAFDRAWFEGSPNDATCQRLLQFFTGQGVYLDHFSVDGRSPSGYHSVGLIAMNAVAGLAASWQVARPFVAELWSTPIPSGQARYYDGALYLLALLHASGQFRIYPPQ